VCALILAQRTDQLDLSLDVFDANRIRLAFLAIGLVPSRLPDRYRRFFEWPTFAVGVDS